MSEVNSSKKKYVLATGQSGTVKYTLTADDSDNLLIHLQLANQTYQIQYVDQTTGKVINSSDSKLSVDGKPGSTINTTADYGLELILKATNATNYLARPTADAPQTITLSPASDVISLPVDTIINATIQTIPVFVDNLGNALYFQNLNLSNLSQANVIEIVTNIQEGFSELLKNDYLTTKNFNSDMTDSVSSQYQSFVAKEMILYDLPLLGKLDTFLGMAYYKHEFDNLNEYTYSDTLKSLIANILNESVSDGSFTIKIMVETWNAKLESLYPEGIPDTSAIFKQLPSTVFESSPESDSDGPIEAKNITDVSNLTFSTNGCCVNKKFNGNPTEFGHH
ncbi:hypothetical protein [Pediococcus parvulus]|nr:hypothetical protein [Pediococcus parvulus]MCT3027145.1 hypothetical protein [Pediococcus parvulus]GHC08497.1 hypothetical protein GCM10008912_10090 [Pediococcus parvulus]